MGTAGGGGLPTCARTGLRFEGHRPARPHVLNGVHVIFELLCAKRKQDSTIQIWTTFFFIIIINALHNTNTQSLVTCVHVPPTNLIPLCVTFFFLNNFISHFPLINYVIPLFFFFILKK